MSFGDLECETRDGFVVEIDYEEGSVVEGAGSATADEALDPFAAINNPGADEYLLVEEGEDTVRWQIVVDGDRIGEVVAARYQWGLWGISSVVQCVYRPTSSWLPG